MWSLCKKLLIQWCCRGVNAGILKKSVFVCVALLSVFVCRRTQKAYILQKLGRNEAALKLYNQVMKQRWGIRSFDASDVYILSDSILDCYLKLILVYSYMQVSK